MVCIFLFALWLYLECKLRMFIKHSWNVYLITYSQKKRLKELVFLKDNTMLALLAIVLFLFIYQAYWG